MLDGVPRREVATRRILLDRLEVEADIGFHEREIGKPQRLLVSVEIWLTPEADPRADEEGEAWNYDFIRDEIRRLAGKQRYNLQETLVRAIFDRIAAVRGVADLTVRSIKPDIYDDAEGVGVEYSSRS